MTPPSIDEIRLLIAETPVRRLPALLDELSEDPRAGVQNAVRAGRARLEAASAERARLTALYRLETRLRRDGYAVVAGIDEVGRGALAGPLTAAAVVLPASPRIEGLNDSKQLTRERRERLAEEVHSVAVCVTMCHVPSDEIDAIGIAGAVRRAMVTSLEQLEADPDHVLVDGLPVGISTRETAVVKGDSSVAAIAAASIVAKVARDALMREFASEYPDWGFDVNKGYGTTEHMRAIARFGLSPIHRRSFGPCGGTLNLF